MKRDEALLILSTNRERLQGFGVKRLDIFGSVARDEAGEDSDVDILVEFGRPVGLFEFVRLKGYLEELLGCEVDLGTLRSLKQGSRERVLDDAINVP